MTQIVADPSFRDHLTGETHPESPERYTVVMEALKDYPVIAPRDATEEEIRSCHTKEYIDIARKDILRGDSALSTGDVQISPKSFEVALKAAGAVIAGVDSVLNNRSKTVFCAVRPPGHHACSNRGMGFCIFNNIAIGARYAQKKYGVKRILIADFDLHHGNGTQEIFYNDPSVFYFSTHQWPLYPGTGSPFESGAGNILNVPIAAMPNAREKILDAYATILPAKMIAFKPELVMISAGFDAHAADPLGALNLKTEDYGTITQSIKNIANQYAKGRIVSALEGGYNLQALAASVKEHVRVLG